MTVVPFMSLKVTVPEFTVPAGEVIAALSETCCAAEEKVVSTGVATVVVEPSMFRTWW
jgi:hypothetical protein